jgi:hypothetical protein
MQNRVAMAERPGESKSDASDKNKIDASRTYRQPENFGTSNREAVGSDASPDNEASAGKTRFGEKHQAGASGKSCRGSVGAGVVQAVQERLGSDRGTYSERARYALRLPVLPQVASRAWSSAGFQKDAASAMGPLAPCGGIGNRWDAH